MIAVLWMSIPLTLQYRESLSANDGGTMRYLRFVQRSNALFSIVVRLAVAGKVTKVSPVHSENAFLPI